MKDIKVASRYAKSLLDLSLEKGQLEKVKDDMLSVYQSIKESRELELLLANPIVKTDKKLAVLNVIFKDKLGEIISEYHIRISLLQTCTTCRYTN